MGSMDTFCIAKAYADDADLRMLLAYLDGENGHVLSRTERKELIEAFNEAHARQQQLVSI